MAGPLCVIGCDDFWGLEVLLPLPSFTLPKSENGSDRLPLPPRPPFIPVPPHVVEDVPLSEHGIPVSS